MVRLLLISVVTCLLAAPAYAQEFVPGEVIVKLKSQSGKGSALKSQFLGKVQGKLALKASFGRLNVHKFSLKDSNQSVQETVNELRMDPDVEYAEPNYILKKINDEGSSSQSYSAQDLQSMASYGDGNYYQSGANIHMKEAWANSVSLSSNPSKVIVAVIDTGVDYNHNAFIQSNSVWVNQGEIPGNGIDDDRNGYIDDVKGWNFFGNNSNAIDDDNHGTHVAGIIIGASLDIFASTRDESKILIMPLKFLGANGSGSTSDAVEAIYYAVNMGAQVINNSWGGPSYSQSLHDALTYAYNNNVSIVSAAGNYTSDNDSVAMYPANYPVPGQISVAATSDSDNIASFSNFGVNSVHVAAPGVSILSTTRNNTYKYMSGTSMAAPLVAGLAALTLRENANLSGYQVKNLILNTSTPINNLSSKIYSSARVDALRVVNVAQTEVATQSYLPGYVAKSLGRDPASETTQGAGCGLVSSAFMRGSGSSSGGPFNNTSGISMILALTLLPLVVWQVMRTRENNKNRRKHERFVMNSEVRVNVNGRELVGQMQTISLGGISFNADAMLEKGGVVTMQIASPEGSDKIEVQGHIVWSEANKAYGVKFDEAKQSTLESISAWTRGLAKARN